MGFNSYIIYGVYDEEQNKVIKVKDLQIFEDTLAKMYLSLPNFDKKLIFNEVQLSDTKEERLSSRSIIFEDENMINKYYQKFTSLSIKHPK